MKKKILIIVGIVMAIVIPILIIILIKENSTVIPPKTILTSNKDFTYMGEYEETIIDDEDYTFTNYGEYYDIFKSNNLKEANFVTNNYVLVPIQYDPCSESNITPVGYFIKKDEIEIEVEYTSSCGVCKPKYIYYLLKVSKNLTNAKIHINYKALNKSRCGSAMAYKPIIYLYPEKKTLVTVKLGYPNNLTTTYPKYKNEWKVLANPNGDLKDENNTYYGLYWEGYNVINPSFEDGFIVKGKDAINFLEEKLTILGLNYKERNEFIIYWLPKLENNKYNLIRFETMENINKNMPLEITPKPDTIIRVLMEYKPLNEKISIKKQKLSTPKRRGFTVVEWGGSEIK